MAASPDGHAILPSPHIWSCRMGQLANALGTAQFAWVQNLSVQAAPREVLELVHAKVGNKKDVYVLYVRTVNIYTAVCTHNLRSQFRWNQNSTGININTRRLKWMASATQNKSNGGNKSNAKAFSGGSPLEKWKKSHLHKCNKKNVYKFCITFNLTIRTFSLLRKPPGLQNGRLSKFEQPETKVTENYGGWVKGLRISEGTERSSVRAKRWQQSQCTSLRQSKCIECIEWDSVDITQST